MAPQALGYDALCVSHINQIKPSLGFQVLVAEYNPNCYPQSVFLLSPHNSSCVLKDTLVKCD